jgi:hypothetical protein
LGKKLIFGATQLNKTLSIRPRTKKTFRMKRLLPFIFTLLTLSFSTSLKASHMMGGDMSYRCLGNGQYKITAKIYRDCRGISFSGPSFGVYAGTNGGNGCGSSGLSITRTSIKDVTPRCSTASSPCTPQNTGGTGENIPMR